MSDNPPFDPAAFLPKGHTTLSTNSSFDVIPRVDLASLRYSLPDPLESLPPQRLIVGVDYGTTYSGVSYTTTSFSGALEDINVISTWPGAVGSKSGVFKAPSRIAYQIENAQKCVTDKWGYEVTPNMNSYSWTKLLLDMSAKPADFDDPTLNSAFGRGMMQLPPDRDAPSVVEDYLRLLYNCAASKLKRELSPEIFDRTPMDCWITMPAIWSDKAQSATHDAAKKAGWASRPEDRIFMIPEPEAAAVATLTSCMSKDALDPIKPGDIILVCDCGGGTVDITTYEIERCSPRLEFKEVCVGGGGKCGSTYIDRNFHSLMSKRFGAAFNQLDIKVRGPGSRFMQSFEDIKCGFGETELLEQMTIEPFVMNVQSSEHYDAETSTVNLSPTDLEDLFEPVLKDVVGLIEEQAAQAKVATGRTVNRVILVGGFGSSPRLYKEIDVWCKNEGKIQLMCPQHPQAAIVRGAALRGLHGIVPSSRKCRKHYGYACAMAFRPGEDPENKAFHLRFDNTKYCKDRMSWIIAKGEDVSKETRNTEELHYERAESESTKTRVTLHSCGEEHGPDHSEDSSVDTVGDIKLDFSFVDWDSVEHRRSANGTKVFRIYYEISVMFGEEEGLLKYKICMGSTVVGTAEIEYDRF